LVDHLPDRQRGDSHTDPVGFLVRLAGYPLVRTATDGGCRIELRGSGWRDAAFAVADDRPSGLPEFRHLTARADARARLVPLL